MAKYIFVIGGVMSSVGKGVIASSVAKIVKSKGYKTTCIKVDPYINVDAGTMNPIEHGEVFVTYDKDETDQDLGNYERFIDEDISSANYMTTGRVYLSVIEKERNLKYGGKCVEVVPHIPLEIIDRIKKAQKKADADIVLIEIGGTVGEYQNILFLEAARMMKLASPKDVLFIMVSYLPIPAHVGEMKTKPTQHAVRTLNSSGIQPDILVCRGQHELDEPRKQKLATFCNVPKPNIISAPDVPSIYEVPLILEKQNIGNNILDILSLKKKKSNLVQWKKLVDKTKNLKKEVKIAVVGKYFATGKFTLADSYFSVIEAVKQAAWANDRKPILTWVDSEVYEKDIKKLKELKGFDGIIVPGGFGKRGIEGIISSIKYARENDIPFLGLCYGMQLAVVEFARNMCGLKDANSTEINEKTKSPVMDILEEHKELIVNDKYGGTMRLGSYPANLKNGSIVRKLYHGKSQIEERHRHRYEVNPNFISTLESKGLVFSGVSPDRKLMEFMELPKNKFHIATQSHPEFNSRFGKPSPLFYGFVKSML